MLVSSKFLIALPMLLTICCFYSPSSGATPLSHFYSWSHSELRLRFLFAIIGSSAGSFLFAPCCVLVRYARVCAEIETQCSSANEEICVAETNLLFSQLLRKCWPRVRAFPRRWEYPAPGSPWWFGVNSGHISISEWKSQFPQWGALLGTALCWVAIPKYDRTGNSFKAALRFYSMRA